MNCLELPKEGEESSVAIVYYTDLSSEVKCLNNALEACNLLEDSRVIAAVLVTEGGRVLKALGRAGGGPSSFKPAGADSLVYPGAGPMKVRALEKLVQFKDLYKSVCGGRQG